MITKAIILMAGMGVRLGSSIPKQFLPLGRKRLYEHTLEIFTRSALFQEIILVCPEGWQVPDSIIGGQTRQESTYRGLLACGNQTDYVVIHDGTRPFISIDLLERHIEAVQLHGAINTCVPSYDTLNHVIDDKVIAIPDRTSYMRGQTPQSFAYPLILEAHQKTAQTNATDDCSLILEQGKKVHVLLGSDKNQKITTLSDLIWAEFQMEREELKKEQERYHKEAQWQNSIFTTQP